MAQIFQVNVYSLNNNQWLRPQQWAFNPTTVRFRSVYGIITQAGTRMYGIIEQLPSGLVVDKQEFYVVETVAQLATLANA